MNGTDTLSSSFRICSWQLLTSLLKCEIAQTYLNIVSISLPCCSLVVRLVATIYSSYSHNHALLRTELTNLPISMTFGIYSECILQTRETIPFFTGFNLQGLQSSFQVRSLKLFLISSSASVIERISFCE